MQERLAAPVPSGAASYRVSSFQDCLDEALVLSDTLERHCPLSAACRDPYKQRTAYILVIDLHICTRTPTLLLSRLMPSELLAHVSKSDLFVLITKRTGEGSQALV